jgi:hypothetical protein
MKRFGNSRWLAATLSLSLSLAILFLAATVCASDQPANSTASLAASSGLYVKVQLNAPVKFSKLKPGDLVEGTLARDVYSADREVFSSGSAVRLTVDHLEKRRREPNDHWPGVIKLFTPRHENFPVFKAATVSGAAGESALRVSMISVSTQREVLAQTKKRAAGQPAGPEAGAVEVGPSQKGEQDKKKPVFPTIILEAFGLDNDKMSSPTADASARSSLPLGPQVLPAGSRWKILLLGDVSASKSNPGDLVQARLLEPVLLDSHVVLPAGSLVEGKVVKKIPPRMLSRAGSLYLTFTDLTLPGGNRVPIAATLAGAELDRKSHTKMDKEGGLHGEHPGKAWMAINIGVTAGIAKEADDTFQLIFEAIISTATDTSTAGTGRIIAACASTIYLATRHGRDVIIPRFTEMNISLDRPLTVTQVAVVGGAQSVHGN